MLPASGTDSRCDAIRSIRGHVAAHEEVMGPEAEYDAPRGGARCSAVLGAPIPTVDHDPYISPMDRAALGKPLYFCMNL